MRKRVGNENGVSSSGGGRRLEKREESMHRKAAALAWYRHGRKGTTFLGSGRGGKMKNPLFYAPYTTGRHHHSSSDGATNVCEVSGSYIIDHKEHTTHTSDMGGLVVAPQYSPYILSPIEPPNIHPQAHLSPTHQQANFPPLHHSPTHQASRFKAEALALQSSSSSSSSSLPSPSAATSSCNKQQLMNMSTGQSLALLSLLPHQQSQKCFNLSKKEYAGSSSSSSGGGGGSNNTTPWDCGSSLYDSFELLCLSNQLGRCLTTVNAAAMSGSGSASSLGSGSKVTKNLAPPLQGPSLQPTYIPRSLYALPQFMIPNYLATKSAKKRSSLIHPIFSTNIPATINISAPSSPKSLLAPPPDASSLHNQCKKTHSASENQAGRKKEESGGGFRRVFNSLLKSLHMKEDPASHKPKRSNLSEELEKLPKNRPPSSRGALLYENEDMAATRSPNFSSGKAMESRRSPTSSVLSPSSSAAAMASRKSPNSSSPHYQYHHHFRNEGFRTTCRPPKAVKWVQPGAS
eukprot:c21566_g1_i1 orf=184-1734(-)